MNSLLLLIDPNEEQIPVIIVANTVDKTLREKGSARGKVWHRQQRNNERLLRNRSHLQIVTLFVIQVSEQMFVHLVIGCILIKILDYNFQFDE